jgi:outer membrane protein OmpU
MNNFKKIGLSALAGSLVAFSVNAAEMGVTGGASLTISDQGAATEGNTWTMGNSITFAASGELDNGLTISSSYELDDDIMDDYSMTVATSDMGTIKFDGSGGSSALSAVDDVVPNAYEEAWHGATGANMIINGIAGVNQFKYTSPSVGGAVITASYLPSSAAVTVKSSVAWAVAVSPEMVDGLTLGYATQEDESGTANTVTSDTDESTMYIKYVTGAFTVGYQASELDAVTNSEDKETTSFGLTYAVSDDLTIGYGQHATDTTGDSTLSDQESTAITASYTMGGMTIAGIMNDVDNVAGTSTDDKEAYELNLSFAF